MEYLEGGTLEQAVKSFHFSEKQIAYVAKEVRQIWREYFFLGKICGG